MSLDRRDFIWLLGGAGSGYLASRLPFPRLTPLPDDDDRIAAAASRGFEERVTSSCLLCPGGCGIRARKVDGQVVRITGNTDHPLTRGGLCPKGIAGTHLLYSPDRIKRPLLRVGERGSGEFEPLEWEDALDRVTSKLQEIRQNRPQALAIFDGCHPGSMNALISRFARAFGTPNHIRDYYHDGMELASLLMHGKRQLLAWDLPRSRFVLSFGTSLLDSWWSPTWASRAYGELHQEREDVRGELIQVDSRHSTTAVKADRWIPIAPDTYGVLALGIAYVIVKEDLYDQSFLDAHVHGFAPWRQYLLNEVSLDRVSDATGIPIAEIIGTAKEFARKRPAVAIADQNAVQGPDGAMTAMAIHALNILVGSVEKRGGVLLAPDIPFSEGPELEVSDEAAAGLEHARIDGAGGRELPLGTSSTARALEAIAGGDPYAIEVLILHQSNPLFSLPDADRVRKALARVPMVISTSPFLDESALMADLVLPDHLFLERWDDIVHPPVHAFPTLGLVRPVVDPLFHTRHTGDVLLELAARLGPTLHDPMPWQGFEDYLKSRLRGVFEAHRGTNFTESFEQSQVTLFEESGFWLRAFDSFEDFWSKVSDSGGWVDPVYHYKEWGRVVATPSRKIELRSSKLESLLEGAGAPLVGEPIPRHPMAQHDSPAPSRASEEELSLVVFRPLTLSSGTLALLPWMHEILGYQSNLMWDSWVEIHPDKARALGIEDRGRITLTTDRGSISTTAVWRPGGQEGVLHMPYGLGHTGLGQFADGVGVSPNDLLSLDRLGAQGAPHWVISVRVRKGEDHA